jgi:hypothetical protein
MQGHDSESKSRSDLVSGLGSALQAHIKQPLFWVHFQPIFFKYFLTFKAVILEKARTTKITLSKTKKNSEAPKLHHFDKSLHQSDHFVESHFDHKV